MSLGRRVCPRHLLLSRPADSDGHPDRQLLEL
jgi:hypothetical protein